MKLISYEKDGSEKYGMVEDTKQLVWDIQALAATDEGESSLPASLIDAIALGEEWFQAVADRIEKASDKDREQFAVSTNDVKWLAPIPRPAKNIMCIGKNYRDHAIEMGGEESIPTELLVFTKSPTTVIPQQEVIPAYSDITDALDYEGELAVIIGKAGKGIKQEEALDHVFGYTVINDVTARDIQKRHKQFFLGKSLDGTCPMGPWIVTKDEIADPHKLKIETKVNGEIRQQSNTSHFIFSINEIISVLSKGMTLEPGDIIATGTPAGVGFGMNPPGLLKSGDEIEINVEKIGTLKNKVQ